MLKLFVIQAVWRNSNIKHAHFTRAGSNLPLTYVL